MNQFNQFSGKKSEFLESLKKLRQIVIKLDDVGIDISDDVKKIENAISNLNDDVLRIAMLGAFADGKTSVIAGWLGHIMADMKIDIDESSDEIVVYHPENLPDKCEIVDTPGLFGDKEKSDEQNRTIKYSKITQKYISEAHLIFYVVDATNPLKDSHKGLVQWVLRDLNKLSSTIFIINKMDEVADLRDQEQFQNQADIKKGNLLGKLDRYLDLTEEEKARLNIVCLSSNPNNRGLEFWFEKRDIYEERSRIADLKQITNQILDKSTKELLIKKTGRDVIVDVVNTKISAAEDSFTELNLYSDELKFGIKQINEDIANGKKAVLSAKKDLLGELDNMEKDLLGKVRVLSAKDIIAFLEDELGHSGEDTGYKLRLKIETVAEECFQQSANIMNEIGSSIERQLDSSESFLNAVSTSALKASGSALKTVSKMPVSVIKDGVFAARNAIAKLTGTIFKFKPWGATKLAANISRWAGPVSAALQVLLDAVNLAQKRKAEKELADLKKEISDFIIKHFKLLYDLMKDNSKVLETFAPQLAGFEDILRLQQQSLENLQKRQLLLEKVKDELSDVIEAEYTVI